MSDHHHNHGHGHCHDEDGHDHSSDITPAQQDLLYSHINFDAITTLNESTPHSGAAIVKKTWSERLNESPELESDADEQLLMTIPFTGQVTLHTIHLNTPPTPSAPKTLKLYKNRLDLDFPSATELKPTQTLELPRPPPGNEDVIAINLSRALWNASTSVTLFFEDNWGTDGDEEVTRVGYLGFTGRFLALGSEAVSFVYEAAPNPGDHKVVEGVGVKGFGGDVRPG